MSCEMLNVRTVPGGVFSVQSLVIQTVGWFHIIREISSVLIFRRVR